MEQRSVSFATLVVPRLLVKKTKSALEAFGKLDKRTKICALDNGFIIPTTIPLPVIHDSGGVREKSIISDLVHELGLQDHEAEISLIPRREANQSWSADANPGTLQEGQPPSTKDPRNLLAQTIEKWLLQIPQKALASTGLNNIHAISTDSKWTYTIYPPLLLLPPTTFSPFPPNFLTQLFPSHSPSLYNFLCKDFHITHIALNGPIPLHVSTTSPPNHLMTPPSPTTSANTTLPNTKRPNTLRAPSTFTPLHGSFGAPHEPPAPAAFTKAFWCTSLQNGIFQTWAPRHTMFSRGNVSEKARILRLDSLREERLQCEVGETSAVDLYAGIGYFAFCYAKAGVGRVLCWEINGWSVEGLRRGAGGNRWGVGIVRGGEGGLGGGEEERLVVFEESNEGAAERVEGLRDSIPPVRHVNCGFLPSSRGSWETAVRVLDPWKGGWVHVHENIGRGDIEARKEGIVACFGEILERVYGTRMLGKGWEVECEHLERVKSYAPGVVHCVLDIAIRPRRARGIEK